MEEIIKKVESTRYCNKQYLNGTIIYNTLILDIVQDGYLITNIIEVVGTNSKTSCKNYYYKNEKTAMEEFIKIKNLLRGC